MARIDVLPSIDIIRGFKGILDFYLWRGLPCVRAWPKYRPAKQTAASLAAALTFGAIVKAYSLLANQALLAYREDALDQPRTARDIMVTGVYGNLHEASMSDFLDALIIIRDAVIAQTALLNALHSIDTDELVVRTEHSVLPDGAAIEARQLSQLLALQKIDDLQDALESKALDRLLVRGMDQLFSLKDNLLFSDSHTMPGAGNHSMSGPVCPADEWWVLTNIQTHNNQTIADRVYIAVRTNGNSYTIKSDASPVVNEGINWQGWIVLKNPQFIRARWLNNAGGDVIALAFHGFRVTLET